MITVISIVVGFAGIVVGLIQLTKNPIRKKKFEPFVSKSPKATSESIWISVNHSKSTIDYLEINKSFSKKIRKFLRDHYEVNINSFYNLQQVDEISGTINYKISSRVFQKHPYLFRIHKRFSDEFSLSCLQKVQKHIYLSDCFQNSPHRECLNPIITKSGESYTFFGEHLVEVYPFASNAEHFSGESIQQIKSLAYKYGCVQKKLKELNSETNIELLSDKCPNLFWFNKNTPDLDLYRNIMECNDRAIKSCNVSRFTELFNNNKRIIEETWDQIKQRIVEPKLKNLPILHDFHPHNCFFIGHDCTLIYDYEAVSRYWSLSEALAFTLHRFTREYLRNQIVKANTPISYIIPQTVDTFLESYSNSGDQVPTHFTQELSHEIKVPNMAKLLGIMSYYYKLHPDPAGRPEDVWYMELKKFISFIKEAEFYKRI